MRKKGVFLEYSIEIALIGREGGNILSVKQNLPLSGVSNPPIMRRVVVLPQPDGPMNAVISFSGMSILIFFSAWKLP